MNVHPSVIIEDLWWAGGLKSQYVEKCEFFVLFGKRTLVGKFSKYCSGRIHHLNSQRVMFKFHEIWPTENGQNRGLVM